MGEGTVNFNNRVVTAGIDAPVILSDGQSRATGPNYVALPLGGSSEGSLAPLGAPVPLKTGILAGYFAAGSRTIHDIEPGGPAYVAVAAWDSTKASSYEEARAAGSASGFGQSPTLYLPKTGNPAAAPPDLPVDLAAGGTKLESFTVGS